MLGPASQEPQVPKLQKPSRLRNEMRHTPSDESTVFVDEDVQVPDSQTAVPDTQHDSDSLSPSSAAMYRRNCVRKNFGSTSLPLLPIKPFVKEGSLGESNVSAESSIGFSFFQPRKGSEKPVSKLPKPLTSAKNGPPITKPVEAADEKPESSPSFTASKSAMPNSSLQPRDSNCDVVQKSEVSHSSTGHPECNIAMGHDDGRELHESFSDAPTSAQPTSSHLEARKKILVAKKVKKAKRGPRGRQQNSLWPPRSRDRLAQMKGSSLVLEEASHKIGQTCMAGSPDIQPNVPEHNQLANSVEGSSEHAERSNRCDPSQDQPSPHSAPEVLKASPLRNPSGVSTYLVDSSRISASRSPDVRPGVRPNTNDIRKEAAGASVIDGKPTEAANPPFKPCTDAVHEAGEHSVEGIGSVAPISQPAELQIQLRNHLDQGESTICGVSHRPVPHHVEKSQKHRRSLKVTQRSSTPAPISFPDAPKQLSFKQTWDMLRMAHHTNLSRRDHDVAIQAEHFKQIKTLLQDQINQYSMSLVEEKSQHEILKVSMSNLREKARTNQKFAAGLQKDYEKLQRVSQECQEECKKTLQQKALEMEHEKDLLRHEVGLVLENVAKGHKKLKSTADELYLRLEFSEAKQKSLTDELTKQTALLAEEKATRNDLERQFLSLGPCIQDQLRNYSDQLVGKLENLQASVHIVSSQQQQKPSGVDECLDALRQLQDTPFLTLEHVKKSETMLHAVYEGLGAGLDDLTKSVTIKSHPIVDMQTFVKERLEKLQAAMLKFDELSSQNRKTQDSNITLRLQLEAEQRDVQRLRKEIDNLHQHEQSLDSSKADLESRVLILEQGNNHAEEMATLRQRAKELERELKQLQEECKAMKAESDQLRLSLQTRDREASEHNLCMEKLREEKKQLEEKARQQDSKEVDLRKKIGDNLKHELNDEIRKFRNDIDRLAKKCNEKDVLIQEQNENMLAAKARSAEIDEGIQKLHSEIEAARKDRIELDARLEKAQKSAQNESESVAEVARVKEQLKQRERVLEHEEEELRNLRQECSDLDTENSNLRTTCEQQQIEINQHPSKLESLRCEIEHEALEKQQKEDAEAQQEADNMREERDNLLSKLQQAQLYGSQLNEAHAALVAERDALKQSNIELEKISENNESRLRRQEEEVVAHGREHEQKLNDVQRQLEQSTEAVRVADAKNKLQQAEHSKKLEFDRKKYELLVHNLIHELEETRNYGPNERDTTQASPRSLKRSDALERGVQNSNSKKSRMKVDRGNYSILNMATLSGTTAHSTGTPMITRGRSPRGNDSIFDRNDNLFEEESHRVIEEDSVWDQGASLVGPDAEPVEDTQEMPTIAMVLKDMDASESSELLEGTRREIPADQSSLSSPPPSEELARLSDDNRKSRTPITRTRDLGVRARNQQDKRVLATPVCGRDAYSSSSQSSQMQARPLSQANTSSSMMAPPPTTSETFVRSFVSKEDSRHGALGELDRSPRHGDTSLDVPQRPSSNSFRTTDSRHGGLATPSRLEYRTDMASSGSHMRKRKITSGQEESNKRRQHFSKPHVARSSESSSHQFRISQSEQDRKTAAGTTPFQSRSSASLRATSPVIGSRSNFKASTTRAEHSSPGSKPRDIQSSTSRLTTPARSHRVYGRHQTRSKTHETDRFDKELRGL